MTLVLQFDMVPRSPSRRTRATLHAHLRMMSPSHTAGKEGTPALRSHP